MLLSRVAEGVYWAGRYPERAEATARLVKVHTELFLDLPRSAGVGWSPLLAVTGSGDAFSTQLLRCRRGRGGRVPGRRRRQPRLGDRVAGQRPRQPPGHPDRRSPLVVGGAQRPVPVGRGHLRSGRRPPDATGVDGPRRSPVPAVQRLAGRHHVPRRVLFVPRDRPVHRSRRHDDACPRRPSRDPDRPGRRPGQALRRHHLDERPALARRPADVPAAGPRPGHRDRRRCASC